MSTVDQQTYLKAQHITSLLEYVFRTSYKAKDGVSEALAEVHGLKLKRTIGYLMYVVKIMNLKYDANTMDDSILRNCKVLFGRDYKYSLLSNAGGELCGHYPSELVIQEYVKSEDCKHDDVESIYDMNQLQTLVSQAKSARCRSRFVVPVILYEGKHICRSATIAGGAEMYGRQFYDFFTSGGTESNNLAGCRDLKDSVPSDMQIFDRIRGQDIRLLKTFNVGFIFDLMLEQKKVKFGMNVTSSEKVDKENRYSEFSIASVPYPGCEFFKEWKNNGYRASGLMFDWNQGFVDTKLDIPFVPSPPRNIDWCRYQNWDLVNLTQNYLKLLLHYIKEGDTGILVHCISGWDRTPLFISLLRLSLWAEGLVHSSLSALEILYLTIGYDWYLFGHHFPDRLSRGEEVFFFCFTFLQYITGDEFNVSRRRTKRRVGSTDFVDGILLDSDRVGSSHRGSNSSISSVSSLNSTQSSIDHQFPIFSIDGTTLTDDDTQYSTMKSSNATLRLSPGNRCSPVPSVADQVIESQLMPTGSGTALSSLIKSSVDQTASLTGRASPRDSSVSMKSGSSPVPVPRPVRRLTADSKVESLASCGSWQLISGPESFRCTPSSASSHRSSSSENNESSGRNHSRSSSSDASRRQRLDDVRHLFVKQYCAVMGSCSGASNLDSASLSSGSSGGGMFTGLLENFAEKVGIRPARSGFY